MLCHLEKLDDSGSFPGLWFIAAYSLFFIPSSLLWQLRSSLQDRSCRNYRNKLLCRVSFLVILTFFLLVNNLCFHSSWHVGCFCSFMRLLLLVYRKILFYFSDVQCFLFDCHVIFTCLKFLSLVLISLYCSSDFHLILRALHLFPSSEFEREKSSKFFHVCWEVACIGVYIINAFLR